MQRTLALRKININVIKGFTQGTSGSISGTVTISILKKIANRAASCENNTSDVAKYHTNIL